MNIVAPYSKLPYNMKKLMRDRDCWHLSILAIKCVCEQSKEDCINWMQRNTSANRIEIEIEIEVNVHAMNLLGFDVQVIFRHFNAEEIFVV